MNAMTWWDHETDSIWSQPWGAALRGPLKGAKLELLSSNIAPWETWRQEHPNTVVLSKVDSRGLFAPLFVERRRDDFVIGISLGEAAKAFYYKAARRERVINDTVVAFPVLLYVNPENRSIKAYLRQAGDRLLTFALEGETLLDRQTRSRWDPVRGLATDGPLRGTALQQAPYISSFDWAWKDFYPQSTFYR